MLTSYDVYYADADDLKCISFETVFDAEDFINAEGLKSYLLQASQCDDDFSYPRYTNLIDKSKSHT